MSNREMVLQRLEAAMASLEAAAERRLSKSADAGAGDTDLQNKLTAVTAERDGLAEQVEQQSKRNADLGARLDKAIAKLSEVLEQA